MSTRPRLVADVVPTPAPTSATGGWWRRRSRRQWPAIVVQRRGAAEPIVPARYAAVRTHMVDEGKGGLRLRQLERRVIATDARAIIVGDGVSPVALRALAPLAERLGCALVYPAPGSPMRGSKPTLIWAGDQPFFELGSLAGDRIPVVKRAMDLLGATAGVILLAPLLGLIALGIRLDSNGPVLFAQPRAGWHGRRFRMLKFRTMRHGADEEKIDLAHLNASGDRRLFKIPNDPRVTRFGRFLRRWSLDELPQVWNVLVGDMSLVGPRPFFESDLQDYEAHHFRRLSVKPGITGNWQVRGRSDILDFEEVVRLDREYIERWSLWLDLRILAQTLPAVMRRTGAY